MERRKFLSLFGCVLAPGLLKSMRRPVPARPKQQTITLGPGVFDLHSFPSGKRCIIFPEDTSIIGAGMDRTRLICST